MTKDTETFVRITNKDIYNSIQELKSELSSFRIHNEEQHNNIIRRQDHTNGKVRLNRWIATTALTLVTTMIGILLIVLKVLR